MTIFHGYAASEAGNALTPYDFEPAPLKPTDVEIEISHCGVCHSDLHLIDNDWQVSGYPLVPGHEVVGVVRAKGDAVRGLQLGDRVGVGWQGGACLHCYECVSGHENLCSASQPTCVGQAGGFADRIRVSGDFAFALPDGVDAAATAPLLCGGVTVYSPLARYAKPHHRVGVVGIGGLGHLGIQFASAMGCGVTAFSGSPNKEAEAKAMGADEFCSSRDAAALDSQAGRFDVILSTVYAQLDWTRFLSALKPTGTLVLVGAPAEPIAIPVNLLLAHRQIAGSMIGSRASMRDMLQFAQRSEIGATVETFAMADVNDAIQRVRDNQVRYRAVLST